MFPSAHDRVGLPVVNPTKQRPIQPALDRERCEVCRRWNELQSSYASAVDSMTEHTGVHVNFPSGDCIPFFGKDPSLFDPKITEPQSAQSGHQCTQHRPLHRYTHILSFPFNETLR